MDQRTLAHRQGRSDNVVPAPKFQDTMGDDPNEAGNSRRWIFRGVEASLKRRRPTASTSTRSTAGTRGPTTRRRSAR